jgi:CTP:molybdopterin cytidylyltransferase MocA
MIGGVVLAAGAATRFGGGKQLAELDGRPLLEHALGAMAASGVGRMVVVLGAGAEEIAARVNLHGAEPLICDRWDEGQSASLATALAEMGDADAIVVTLGDQPRMTPDAIRRVIAARVEGAARAPGPARAGADRQAARRDGRPRRPQPAAQRQHAGHPLRRSRRRRGRGHPGAARRVARGRPGLVAADRRLVQPAVPAAVGFVAPSLDQTDSCGSVSLSHSGSSRAKPGSMPWPMRDSR